MKSISVTDAIEKNKLSSTNAYLVALKIDVVDPSTNAVVETLHIVRNSENITLEGQLYIATSFDISIKEEKDSTSSMTVTAVDYSGALQSRMQAYGGGIDFGVEVLVFNSGNLDAMCELREYFKIISATAQNYNVSFTLGADNPLAMRFPGRIQMKDRCSWRFKSEDCGYVGGSESCDLSLRGPNGCNAHQNALNYGGFPGINPRIFHG